jgi:hypothetical protein
VAFPPPPILPARTGSLSSSFLFLLPGRCKGVEEQRSSHTSTSSVCEFTRFSSPNPNPNPNPLGLNNFALHYPACLVLPCAVLCFVVLSYLTLSCLVSSRLDLRRLLVLLSCGVFSRLALVLYCACLCLPLASQYLVLTWLL